MDGADYAGSALARCSAIGSANARGNAGAVLLNMRRGGGVLYRSAPGAHGASRQRAGREPAVSAQLQMANDWVALAFSSPRLPPAFTVRIGDDGQGRGEWPAVAIRAE
jgi:hypothetical protein